MSSEEQIIKYLLFKDNVFFIDLCKEIFYDEEHFCELWKAYARLLNQGVLQYSGNCAYVRITDKFFAEMVLRYG